MQASELTIALVFFSATSGSVRAGAANGYSPIFASLGRITTFPRR